jgi:hypothetical protein
MYSADQSAIHSGSMHGKHAATWDDARYDRDRSALYTGAPPRCTNYPSTYQDLPHSSCRHAMHDPSSLCYTGAPPRRTYLFGHACQLDSPHAWAWRPPHMCIYGNMLTTTKVNRSRPPSPGARWWCVAGSPPNGGGSCCSQTEAMALYAMACTMGHGGHVDRDVTTSQEQKSTDWQRMRACGGGVHGRCMQTGGPWGCAKLRSCSSGPCARCLASRKAFPDLQRRAGRSCTLSLLQRQRVGRRWRRRRRRRRRGMANREFCVRENKWLGRWGRSCASF